MAIRLGDVNFRLGADTSALTKAVSDLKKFGDYVDSQASKMKRAGQSVAGIYQTQGKAAGQAAAAAVASGNRIVSTLQKQEKASVDALRQTLEFNKVLRKTEFGQSQIGRANTAWSKYNKAITSGQLSMTAFNRHTAQFRNSMSDIRRGLAEGSKSMGGFSGMLRRVSQESVLLYGPLGGLAVRLTTLANIADASGAKVAFFLGGLAVAAVGLTAFTYKIIEASKAFQSYSISLTGIYNSQALANQQIQVAADIANMAGLAYSAIIPEYVKFAAAVKDTALQGQKADDVFASVARVAGQLQMPMEQVSGIFKALEQMMSKNVVQSEELRGQLGDRLPGAFNIAARAMRVNTDELTKMLKAGEVIASDFLPKFAVELEKTYGTTGLSKIINYTAAQMRMNNAFVDFFRTVGDRVDITGKMSKIFDLIASSVQFLTKHLTDLRNIILIATSALAGLVVDYLIKGLVAAAIATRGWAAALWGMNAALTLPALSTFISLAAVAATALFLYHDQIVAMTGGLTLFNQLLTAAAMIFGSALVVALGAATIATGGLSAAFLFLRGALLRTGFGVIIVLLGEAAYWFDRLMKATGGFAQATSMLKAVANESFGKMVAYMKGSALQMVGAWHMLAGDFNMVLYDMFLSFESDFVNPIIGAFVGTKDAAIAIWDLLPQAFGRIGALAINALVQAMGAGLTKLVGVINSILTLGGTITALTIPPPDISSWEVAVPAAADMGAAVGKAYSDAMGKSYVTSLSSGSLSAAQGEFLMAADSYAAAAKEFSAAAGPSPQLTNMLRTLGALNTTVAATPPIANAAGAALANMANTADAGGAVDKLIDKYKALKDSITSAFEDAGMAIVQDTKNIGEAFKALATTIITELYKVLVVQKLVGAFATPTSAGTGIMGWLGTAFSGIASAVVPHAAGGSFGAGQPMLVGEKGPELITPSYSGTVTKNSDLGGGSKVIIQQTFQITTGVQQTVRAELKAMMPQIKAAAVQAVMQAKTRGGKAGAIL